MEIIKSSKFKKGNIGFLCPKCGSQDTFSSRDAKDNVWFFCNKCGFECMIDLNSEEDILEKGEEMPRKKKEEEEEFEEEAEEEEETEE